MGNNSNSIQLGNIFMQDDSILRLVDYSIRNSLRDSIYSSVADSVWVWVGSSILLSVNKDVDDGK